jgi:transposase
VRRLVKDLRFKVDCGFLVSDEIPSAASYSRMITLFSESNVLEIIQERLHLQAMSVGFVSDEMIAIDTTHVEARDRALFKTKKVERQSRNNLMYRFKCFTPLYPLNPNGE